MRNLDWRIFQHCLLVPRRDLLKSFLHHVCKILTNYKFAVCVSNFYKAWKHVRDVSSLADPSFTTTLFVAVALMQNRFFCCICLFQQPTGCEIKRDGLQENGFCRLAFSFFISLHVGAQSCWQWWHAAAMRSHPVPQLSSFLIHWQTVTA